MIETAFKESTINSFLALRMLNCQLAQGIIGKPALQVVGENLVNHFYRFVAMPKPGDALVSPLELCIRIIDAAGLSGKITNRLTEVAREAELPGDRAAALAALGGLDGTGFDDLVIERLKEETSNLVLIVLVEVAGDRNLRSSVFCIKAVARKNEKAPTVDGLLGTTCQEFLARFSKARP